jgi:hypothetical protein
MTLSMTMTTPVSVSAWKVGEGRLQLGVGTSYAHLTVDEAQKLRDYLDGFITAAQSTAQLAATVS